MGYAKTSLSVVTEQLPLSRNLLLADFAREASQKNV